MSNRPGMFVISLDFELHWGVVSQYSVADYRENLDGARKAIPAMLDMFSDYGIHATWAIVGYLFFATKADLIAASPAIWPMYAQSSLNPYRLFNSLGENEDEDPYHFAASLVKEIGLCPGQEIASHTFSHYFCLDPGQEKSAFRADMQAALISAKQRGYELKSLVLPANEWNPAYEDVLLDLGFIAYRGNSPGWMHAPVTMKEQTLARRVARFLDTYVNLSGHGNHEFAPQQDRKIIDVQASRFLRPVPRSLSVLEPLRLRRITKGMRLAAESGGMYHLWWHPHNFGKDIDANMAFLENILRSYTTLAEKYGMRSVTMMEAAHEVMDTGKSDGVSRESELTTPLPMKLNAALLH